MKSLLILGRQPALGLAELESLYGADPVTSIDNTAALLDIDPDKVVFSRLGSSIKLTKVLTVLDTTSWPNIESYLSETIPKHLKYLPDGKLRLGLSCYGLKTRPAEINATALRLKKIIKSAGRSVRIVPNKSATLNSAQILHNQLTGPTGWELVLVRHGNKTILAQTTAEQDIEAYAKRDQGRPMRDAKVGMLPPKLAQILVNLATGKIEETGNQKLETRIMDPFCGTGVVLQEAALMGFDFYGSDLEPRMVKYTLGNLKWLQDSHGLRLNFGQVEQGDATSRSWEYLGPEQQTINLAVACETYLGKPLTSLPPRNILEKIINECDQIHSKFLQNIGQQIEPGTRLCLAVPAWRTKSGFLHLPTLDHLTEMGYTRMSFVHASDLELIYHRPNQTVARELVILKRK